jgi:hypothetical protein
MLLSSASSVYILIPRIYEYFPYMVKETAGMIKLRILIEETILHY